MDNKRILLYGANGFTARLIIAKLKELPCELILAGRNHDVLAQLGRKHKLPYRAFTLSHMPTVVDNLSGVNLVINCAGPFSLTALPLAKAALKNHAHYFDITGEISVFQSLFKLNLDAQAKGCAIIPGLGFDIVPSDCLSALLAQRAQKPERLMLAVITKNTQPSHGTLKTAFLHAGQGSIVRRARGITRSTDDAMHQIFLRDREISCVRAPLPDLFCAHLSTGIEHIDTYLALPKKLQPFGKLLPLLKTLRRVPLMKNLLTRAIEFLPNGPSPEQQKNGVAYIVGEVAEKNGHLVRGVLKTPEPYVYTGDLLVAGALHWLSKGLAGGFKTPSQAFGAHFAQETCPNEVTIDFA